MYVNSIIHVQDISAYVLRIFTEEQEKYCIMYISKVSAVPMYVYMFLIVN